MKTSVAKSSFMGNMMDEETKAQISRILPYKMQPLNEGCRYLGYCLKSNDYTKED